MSVRRRYDPADNYPTELVARMRELGLFGATIGQESGGLGVSAATYARIVARIAQAWMAPTGIFNSHLIMAACVERHRYSVDFDVERCYRDSPLMCIGEGTNEMQRSIIARQLVERDPV